MEREHKLVKTYVHLVKVEQPEDGIDLLELFHLLVQNWKHLLVYAVTGILLAVGYTLWFDAPRYEAKVSFYVLGSDEALLSASDMQLADFLAADYREVFSSSELMEEAVQKLGLSYSRERLQQMIRLSNPADTRILYISVVGPNAMETAALANALFEVGSQYIADVMHLPRPVLMHEAVPAQEPVASNVWKRILTGALVGGSAACGMLCLKYILMERKRLFAVKDKTA